MRDIRHVLRISGGISSIELRNVSLLTCPGSPVFGICELVLSIADSCYLEEQTLMLEER